MVLLLQWRDPEPIRFDGMIDAVIIEQSGNNGLDEAEVNSPSFVFA